MKDIVFSKKNLEDYISWLRLNMDGLTWEGRYHEDFSNFLELFFQNGLTLRQLIDRFEFLREKVKTGPLYSWFTWLKEKLLCYTFINYDISLIDLAKVTNQNPSYIAYTMRDFFMEFFPHLDLYFDKIFQLGNVMSDNLYLKFSDMKEELRVSSIERGTLEVDVMRGMEVTLYPEWPQIFELAKREFTHTGLDLNRIKEKTVLYKQLKFLREVVVLFLVCISAILLLRYINKIYEEKLAEKISIFEPQFEWLQKEHTYKLAGVNKEVIEREIKDEELFKKRAEWVEEFRPIEREGTETEITLLASDDNPPKDFDYAEMEKSDYEEQQKGGFRDSTYGRRKVFRVLMKSVDLPTLQKEMKTILDTYEVTKADNVQPGTQIPGGMYYNLFVPIKNINQFFAKVRKEGDGVTIYESSNSSGQNPPGQSKVFIWVKQI